MVAKKKTKKVNKLFTCCECGGDVVMAKKSGHIEGYRNGKVKVPDSFAVPKCKKCGEIFFSGDREVDNEFNNC